ncbi:MAG: hypothetical protein E7213_03680 [Clostridium sp.]|nr:hypothetical protein [Clostridium sp.]
MIRELEKRNNQFINKVIIGGSIAIFIIATLFHFIFDLCSSCEILGIFFPVNESIFEHLKLSFYPTIVYWIVIFLIFNRDYKLNKYKWFTGMTFSIFTCILFVVCYYYVFHYALNISIKILDILSLLVGSLFGQMLGCHVYNKSSAQKFSLIICIMILILTAVFFANFTFYPPKLPLFLDISNGTYGIK